MKSSFKGYFYGIATSMTFGLIPLFTLPVLGKGVGYESILFHRFLFATLALGLMIIVKGESFRIKPRRELPMLVLLALFYTASSLFLLLGYNYMGAGVATTIHFTYPLMVSFIMFSIFKERTDWIMWTAAMSSDRETFQKFIDPLYKYVDETTSRVPISDWHHTDSGQWVSFRARSVIGGYWMQVLMQKMQER